MCSSTMKVINGSFHRPVFKKILKLSSRFYSIDSDYRRKAVYPEILDTSEEAENLRKKHRQAAQIRKLHTVEEKLFAVNLPRYYGWNSLILEEGKYPYNFLPFVQHVTRTNRVNVGKELLYKVLNKDPGLTKEVLGKIRPLLQEALLFELKGRRWQYESEQLSDSQLQSIVATNIIRQINNAIISTLSADNSYIFDSVVDYEPRIESFWSVGGFHPSEAEISARIEKDKDIKEEAKQAPVQHWIQYLGSPALQVRVSSPLAAIDTEQLNKSSDPSVEGSSVKTSGSDVPEPFPYDPSDAFGLEFRRRNGTNIPGFWPGEEREFGLVSYHVCGHLLDRPPSFDKEDTADTLAAQAILASFAWLHAQATYQGFSVMDELTYPFVNQCILTDGRYFSTYVYQLNTTRLDSEHIHSNPRCNICLNLPHLPLYSDIQNNEFIGWNDEVLEMMILPYLNEPVARSAEELKPNLHPTERYLSCLGDEQKERRVWLHKQFMYMYSNRPRGRLPYEIYDWERIYKIKFPMRPMEARLRPFELDCNPLEDRKYYEHMHEYIPKALRPKRKHWTGWRAKFAKTYYPEIEM